MMEKYNYQQKMFVEHHVPQKTNCASCTTFCPINILFSFFKFPTFRTPLLYRLKLLNYNSAASFRTFIQ